MFGCKGHESEAFFARKGENMEKLFDMEICFALMKNDM